MAISEEEVRKIAKLAKLRLTDQEVQLYRSQFVKILDAIDELKSADTSHVPPTASVLGLTNVLREDEPQPFAARERLLEIAPERDGPYYKVPKVIE